MKKIENFLTRIVEAIVNFIGLLKGRSVGASQLTVFSFRFSWEAGFRPVFLVGNRVIDRKHVDALMALLKEKGRTRFTVAGTVTPLLPLLEMMEELPEQERLHFYDIFDNEVTLDTPGVREGLVYLVLDGQHRVAACHTYGFDMNLILVTLEGDPFEVIADYNTGAKNWLGADWISANRANGTFTSPLFDAMDEVGEILPGVSERYKSGILTGNQNGMKKADAVNGRETLVYDEPLVVRGIGFAKAIAVGLPVDGKVSKDRKTVGKWFRRLEGIRTILSVVPQCSGGLISTFDVDMKNFLGHLDNQQVEIIAGLINKRSFGELDAYFLRQYKEYAEIHIEDRESVSAEIDDLYAELAEQRRVADEEARQKAISTTSTNRPPRLQSGSIEDMRLNVEAIDRYNSEKEARSSRKAEKQPEGELS